MSKLARQIILIVFTVFPMYLVSIFLPFGYTLDENNQMQIINPSLFWFCAIFEIVLVVTLIVFTILIWIRKKTPDLTIAKRD